MGALREYLGVLLAVCMIALPGLLLPRAARTALDRGLRETLVMPAQVLTSWALVRLSDVAAGRRAAPGGSDPEIHRQFLERKWETVRPRREGGGPTATPVYRYAYDLALRDRYAPLNRFCRAPVLCRRAELLREGLRLGCGRRHHVFRGAPVFNSEGYLVGLVDDVMPLTSTLSRLGAAQVRLYCDVSGRDGVQGVLVGDWRRRTPTGPAERVGTVELQISSRGTSVSVGDAVVTSSFAATDHQALLPGGIPVGWVDGIETTEEGYVRARVKVSLPGSSRTLYVATGQVVAAGVEAECAAGAAQARYRAELRRVWTVERDLIPGARRQLLGVLAAGRQADSMARIAFAIRSRHPQTYYHIAEPAGAAALGLRPGIACLFNGALAGVMVREDDTLRVRLLTSPELAVRVEVIQPNGVRYRGLLAAADGPLAAEPVPDGWALPGQPRLQLVSLENDGLPVQLPASVVTAAGGAVALPPGIPVGTLVNARDDAFAPAWQVQPYADLGALTYCVALVPTVTLAVSPQTARAEVRPAAPSRTP